MVPLPALMQPYSPMIRVATSSCRRIAPRLRKYVQTNAVAPGLRCSQAMRRSVSIVSGHQQPYDISTSQNHNPNSPSQTKHKWSNSQLKEETARLLFRVQQLKNGETIEGNLHTQHVFNVLEAWMETAMRNRDQTEAPRQADFILRRVEEVLPLNIEVYNVVLQAYACCRAQQDAGRGALALLQHMLHHPAKIRVSTKSFNIVLNALAQSRHRHAGRDAEELVRVMKSQTSCVPDHRTTTGVLLAWAKCRQPNAPQQCVRLLNEAMKEGRVNVVAFNIVIQAWIENGRGREAAHQVEDILRSLEKMEHFQPDTRTYSMVLSAWARCEEKERSGDSARRATAILDRMIDSFRDGVDLEPNVVTFTSCIVAWSHCRLMDNTAASTAERILEDMMALWKETKMDSLRPNDKTFNALLSTWMRCPDENAIERGKDVIARMRAYTQPTRHTYNTLVSGLGTRGRIEDALHIKRWMQEQNDDDLFPDRITYNAILWAMSKDSQYASQAESVLHEMERLAVMPDRYSYGAVVNAWSRSNDNEMSFRAKALVDVMIERYRLGDVDVRPDSYLLTVLMKCCACSNPVDEAMSRRVYAVSAEAMDLLRSGEFGKPTHVSYSTHMLVIKRIIKGQDEAKKLMCDLFEECVNDGAVSEKVLEMLPASVAIAEKLPAAWSKNVPSRDRPLRSAVDTSN